jgi:hypothetical protein
MTADPTIQYAVILCDDEGTTLTLVGDDATSLAGHVFTTLQGWPEATFASEHRAITEGGAMRFDDWPRPDYYARTAPKPVLERFAEIYASIGWNGELILRGLDDPLGEIAEAVKDTATWARMVEEWDRDCAEGARDLEYEAALYRAAVR